jgi:hypothetical protein
MKLAMAVVLGCPRGVGNTARLEYVCVRETVKGARYDPT